MSLFGETFTAVRRVMMLDSDVETLKHRADLADSRYIDHERRLTRIETLIEFGSGTSSNRRPRR